MEASPRSLGLVGVSLFQVPGEPGIFPSCDTDLKNTMSRPSTADGSWSPRSLSVRSGEEQEGRARAHQNGEERGLCPLIPSDLASLPRACLPHQGLLLLSTTACLTCALPGAAAGTVHLGYVSLTETCQEAGYAVKPWRDPSSAVSHKMPGPLSSHSRQRLVASENGGQQPGGVGVAPGGTPSSLHKDQEIRTETSPENHTVTCTLRKASWGFLPLWIFQAVFSL